MGFCLCVSLLVLLVLNHSEASDSCSHADDMYGLDSAGSEFQFRHQVTFSHVPQATTNFAGPLVISPLGVDSQTLDFVLQFIDANKSLLDKYMYQFGGILFRGFNISSAVDFERVALSLEPQLDDFYLGTSPRNLVAPTKHVFTASEFNGYIVIPPHCEMSFISKPPRRIFFYAHRPNQGLGGETPLVDFQRVWEHLDPEVRDRFVSKKVRNIRQYSCKTQFNFDPFKTKKWQDMFQTDDKQAAEIKARREGFEPSWNEYDTIKLTNIQEPSRKHPITGAEVWHNHAQVFHISSIPMEYERVARLQAAAPGGGWWAGLWWQGLHYLGRAATDLMTFTWGEENLGQHATFGTGEPIPRGDIDHVRQVMWNYTIQYPHQKGDVVMLDNFRIAHGRQPYSGPRTILVSWA